MSPKAKQRRSGAAVSVMSISGLFCDVVVGVSVVGLTAGRFSGSENGVGDWLGGRRRPSFGALVSLF